MVGALITIFRVKELFFLNLRQPLQDIFHFFNYGDTTKEDFLEGKLFHSGKKRNSKGAATAFWLLRESAMFMLCLRYVKKIQEDAEGYS